MLVGAAAVVQDQEALGLAGRRALAVDEARSHATCSVQPLGSHGRHHRLDKLCVSANTGAVEASQEENAHRPAVMADVARLAGVSHQTVSRVLNDHPRVAPTTRTRVLAAIEELGYRRNTAARALVTRRSERLGVVSFDTTLYGPASTLLSVEQAAREAGYFVSIVSLKQIDMNSIGEALDHLLDQSVDGIMVIAPQHESAEALVGTSAPRCRSSPSRAGRRDFPSVAVDQHRGAVLATEHLLELGHETIWHVAGPKDWLEAEGRIAGWRDALERAGGTAPPLAAGRLEPAVGLRGRPRARPLARPYGRLRGQRPDGARPAARAARARRPRARGRLA